MIARLIAGWVGLPSLSGREAKSARGSGIYVEHKEVSMRSRLASRRLTVYPSDMLDGMSRVDGALEKEGGEDAWGLSDQGSAEARLHGRRRGT